MKEVERSGKQRKIYMPKTRYVGNKRSALAEMSQSVTQILIRDNSAHFQLMHTTIFVTLRETLHLSTDTEVPCRTDLIMS